MRRQKSQAVLPILIERPDGSKELFTPKPERPKAAGRQRQKVPQVIVDNFMLSIVDRESSADSSDSLLKITGSRVVGVVENKPQEEARAAVKPAKAGDSIDDLIGMLSPKKDETAKPRPKTSRGVNEAVLSPSPLRNTWIFANRDADSPAMGENLRGDNRPAMAPSNGKAK